MTSLPLTVYVGALVVLFLKTVATTVIQAKERLGQRTFAYAEDAAHWGGTQSEDSELCRRAQRVLRNDGETQPWFLVFGALYVVLGAWPAGAPWYFGGYALSRVLHTVWLLWPRQPHRNRAFAVGLLILMALVGHVIHAALP